MSNIIQISNIAATVTEENIKTLFGFIGAIREAKIYFEEALQEETKVSYIVYESNSDAETALHLHNTVFHDRALIVLPLADCCGGQIPDLNYANVVRAPDKTVTGILPKSKNWPRDVISMVVGRTGEQSIITIEPSFIKQGLPTYPKLPYSTEVAKIEEIRRTVLVTNLDSTTNAQQVHDFFQPVAEVKFIRMAGSDNENAAYVEFTDQSSVVKAFGMMGTNLNSRPIMIQHSNVAIVKPSNYMRGLEESNRRIVRDSDSVNGRSRSKTRDKRVSKSRKRSRSRRRSKSQKTARSRRRSKSRSRRPSKSKRKSISRSRRSRSRSKNKKPRKRSRTRSKDRKRRSKERSKDRRKERSRSHQRKSKRRSRSKRREESTDGKRKPHENKSVDNKDKINKDKNNKDKDNKDKDKLKDRKRKTDKHRDERRKKHSSPDHKEKREKIRKSEEKNKKVEEKIVKREKINGENKAKSISQEPVEIGNKSAAIKLREPPGDEIDCSGLKQEAIVNNDNDNKTDV